ncbi:hypothetical protein [Ponticaulis profundi]|uniref:Uncharacterized protein n=1 Tax=Ponticaulis profundi TaxID=2665222 RepID=A0ABW1S8H5_9PROT
MKAEEILRGSFKSLIEAIAKNPEWLKPPYNHLIDDWSYDTGRALRNSGLLLEWKTDMENAPNDKPVVLYDKRDGTHVSAEWDEGYNGYNWATLDGLYYHSAQFTHYAIISTEGVG